MIFFKPIALFYVALEMLDMFGDIAFTIEVNANYKTEIDDFVRAQLLIILIISCISIIVPIAVSVVQVYIAANTLWLKDDTIRDWFTKFDKLLYISSFITGSSFAAVELFNSNILALYVFDMGLYKKHSLQFNNSKIYSIVLLENFPQIILKIWRGILINFNQVVLVSMTWSVISIIVTIISIFGRKKIEATQGYLVITFDVIAQNEIINVEVCQHRVGKIKKTLAVILGINKNLIEIQKPDPVPHGLQIVVNISMTDTHHDFESRNFKGLIVEAQENNTLQKLFQETWDLKNLPNVTNVNCVKIKSKKEVLKTEPVVLELPETKSTKEKITRKTNGESGQHKYDYYDYDRICQSELDCDD